jgi:hypothetical protein
VIFLQKIVYRTKKMIAWPIFFIVNKKTIMADNKDMRDGRDRSRVAANEEYEVQHLAEKFNVKPEHVRRVIEEVGNSREKIEEALRGRSED